MACCPFCDAQEAPLRGIINERFNQPIFGANYLSGVATGVRVWVKPQRCLFY